MSAVENSNLARREKSIWRRIGKFFNHYDIWRILASLCMALVVYSYIGSQRGGGRYATWRTVKGVSVVPGERTTSPDVYLPKNQTLNVELLISVDALHASDLFTPDDFSVEIDLKRLKSGLQNKSNWDRKKNSYVVPYTILESDVVKKPGGVEIREIRPHEIMVRCDHYEICEVPVYPQLDHRNEAEGWNYECQLTPSVIKISGPSLKIHQVKSIQTETIDLHGTIGQQSSVPCVLPKEEGITLLTESVEYKVTAQRDSDEEKVKAFPDIPVYFLNRGDDTSLVPELPPGTPNKVKLHLKGTAKKLKALDPKTICVCCDLTRYTIAGGQTIKLQVLGLPEGVRLEQIFPREVLTLNLKSKSQKSLEHVPETAGPEASPAPL